MLLAQMFKKFEEDFLKLQKAQKELDSKISQEAIQEKLQDSFLRLKNELSNLLKQEANATLAKERNNLKKANETTLVALFDSNLEATAETLSHKINLNALSAQIAKNLEAKNQKQILKLLREALEGEKYQAEIKECAANSALEISKILSSFQDNITQKTQELAKIESSKLLQSLTQEFLIEHKEEVFKSQNFSFLNKIISQDDKLKSLIRKDAKITTRELATKEIQREIKGLDSMILNTIQKNLPDILTDTIPEVGRIRFQGALHLQALGLQSQISFLTNTLLKLSELRAAKLGITHNVLKVH